MTQADTRNWDMGEQSGLILAGDHKLYVGIAGPDRKANEPIIVLMQGFGCIIEEWAAVRRLVVPFARFLWYDRSGMGKSEGAPEQPKVTTAVDVAKQLDFLLKVT
jgi:hypothetical protein